MDRIESKVHTNSPEFQANAAHLAALVKKLKEESDRRLGTRRFRKRLKTRKVIAARTHRSYRPKHAVSRTTLAAYGMYDNPPSRDRHWHRVNSGSRGGHLYPTMQRSKAAAIIQQQ